VAVGAHSVAAQDVWPQRPVRIVVPYSPGASTDNISRRMAQELTARFGQTVLVENKTGAMGTIGIAEVARARPDGHTLLGIDTGFVMLPHLVRSLPYDPRDLVPIGAFVFSPLGVVVQASSPDRSLQDLIARARANPGRITFGSGGIGTFPQLSTEDFAARTGITLLHAPFRGAAEAVQALLAGTIEMQMASPTTVMGGLAAGRLRMLAVSGEQRLALLPEVPTFAEAGLPGFEAYTWTVLITPRGTPPEVVERLNRELGAILTLPHVRGRLAELGVELGRIFSPAETRDFIRAEAAKWAPIVRASGAVLD